MLLEDEARKPNAEVIPTRQRSGGGGDQLLEHGEKPHLRQWPVQPTHRDAIVLTKRRGVMDGMMIGRKDQVPALKRGDHVQDLLSDRAEGGFLLAIH